MGLAEKACGMHPVCVRPAGACRRGLTPNGLHAAAPAGYFLAVSGAVVVGLNTCGFVVTSLTKTHKVTDITVSSMCRPPECDHQTAKWSSWPTLLQLN